MDRPQGINSVYVTAWSEELGLHPAEEPAGGKPHLDAEMADVDRKVAVVLAWHIGSLFTEDEAAKLSMLDQWRRVARAIRVHGLKIVDEKDGPR